MNYCVSVWLVMAMLWCGAASAAEFPTDEPGVIAYLRDRGLQITLDGEGHAVRLMSSGQPVLTADEYQLIGKLSHLEQMGLNAAPLKGDEWDFLHQLPQLKTLSIWHGHHFATLQPFCGLPVESLTIGGCMGLRDFNQENPDQLRNAIVTLKDLPQLKKGNWYHSPLIPDDAHLRHIATNFPALEDLRLDFAAPRGSATNITPDGLAVLQSLPLKVLSLENAGTFEVGHMRSLADIQTLEAVLIDARRQPGPSEAGLKAFRQWRPDVTVVTTNPGDKQPPVYRPGKARPTAAN